MVTTTHQPRVNHFELDTNAQPPNLAQPNTWLALNSGQEKGEAQNHHQNQGKANTNGNWKNT